MKFLLRTIALCLVSLSGQAQLNFSQYFNLNRMRLVDVQDYEEFPFQWNMAGPVQASMNEGLNSMKEERWEKAALNFGETIKLNPSFQAAYYYQAVCYKKLQKFKEAQGMLQTAIRINKKRPEPRLELGEIYQIQNNWEKAKAEFDRAVADNKDYTKGYYAQGLLEQELGRYLPALRLFLKCEEMDPHFAPAFLAQAMLEFREKDGIAKAIPIFDRAIAADSLYRQTYFWRGLALMVQKQTPQAIPDWNRSIQFFPSNPFMLTMRAFSYVELQKYDEAFADFRKVLKIREVSENKFVGGETILDQQIDVQTAAAYMISHCYGMEEEAFFNLKKGFCLLMAGKRGAVESLQVSARMQPSACAFYLMAVVLDIRKSYNESLEYFERAISYDNDIPDAHLKLALYYHMYKRWDEMDKEFKEVLRLQPESQVVLRLRGSIRYDRQDYTGSVEDSRHLLRLDSSDINGRKTLALALNATGDYSGSNAELRDLSIIEPDNESIYDYLARNSLGLADTAQAIAIYKKRKGKTLDPVPRLGLAKVYMYQKKWTAAARETEEIFHPPLKRSFTFTLAPAFASETLYIQGKIAIGMDNNSQALAYLDKAVSVFPPNNDARFLRAQLYLKLGDSKNAQTDLLILSREKYPGADQMLKDIEGK